ncbi:SMC5-SMC6 complex localization factor protein 2 isoform X3 [Hemibagrus wyckioides]|uniref:SMC5-SMC6 complex localization factor protein 2 isoform X3 n=1 Tax=Hemibagrus wyckioides TaxID=337641 RepID=UPI00266D316A|nr:SMC5-SMC6 complex localization factor protein 2 isoform X3 [Hemibagrus wyckioides]
MQSNLRQHITSMVNDIIPLGGPPRHRGGDKGRTHPVPQCSSQETHKKHAHKLKPVYPLSTHMCKTVLERRNRAAADFSPFSKKTFAGDNASMRKAQINSNNNNHLNNERSCQFAGKKVAPLQWQGSYEEQREFALNFFKQLNENLKVGRPVAHIENNLRKMPSVHSSLISSSMSESHKASAPPNSQRRQSLDRSMNQQSQQSVEKMDKPTERDHSSFSLSQGERMHHQTNAPAGGKSLSLKRRRESSAEMHREGKRPCQEELERYSSSTSSSTSGSPPKFIKRAFLKTSNEPVLTLKEKCSPTLNNPTGDRIKASNNVAKQLFQEPRTESNKFQTATPSTTGHGTGLHKEELRRSTENKCLAGLTDRSEISCPSQQPNATSPSSRDVMDSHNSKTIHRARKDVDLVWQDPLDLDSGEDEWLDSCVLSLSSSHSSEEDQLLPLKDILARSTCVLTTPEKMTFSEPSTPGLKDAPDNFKNKATSYKNTLEQMLKEKEQNQKSKELEMQLLQACKEDLLKLDEEDENEEEELSHEQREFLQRFSVTSCVIRDIHPGEEVFTLTNSGRLFNHQSLDLRKMDVTPNNRAQQTLLQAHSEQLLPLLSAGLFRRAFSSSPCQPQVTRWLFQMMSVHPDPIVCAQILQALTTIALSAAQQIVEKSNKKFEVWVPSIQDVALVFLNMGASYVSLFPLEDLQPSFTEGDLLESLEIQPEVTSEQEGDTFPEHNFENIIKYLALCAALCPKVYSDEELLLMLTVVCRVSLETRLQLLPTGDLSCLLQHLLNNMTQWEMQLSQVCQAITNLSEDHHNLRRLVQLLPHSGRGKQLRRHVSLSIISKLLNHQCTYTPSCTELQLSDLRCYLPRMRPSLLLKGLMAAKSTEQQETDDCANTPDQQAYYLCYSLLALTNEASNFEFLPSTQRNELLLLSAELEKHVKCDIRESEKMLYRSKVKDFVARIYTKWHVLLQRSRPPGKLYDQWMPLPENEMPTKKESQFSEQGDTEESLSEAPTIVQSDEEDFIEENEDITIESEEQLEDSDEKIQDETEELQDVSAEMKEKQSLISLDEKDANEMKDDMAMDEELLELSSDGSVESDDDEDLIRREDELLKDDESLDGNRDLVGGENEPEKLEVLEEHVDMLDINEN